MPYTVTSSLHNFNAIFETSFIHVFRTPIEPPSLVLHTVLKSSGHEIHMIIKNLSDQCIVLYKDNQTLQDLTKMITYVDSEKVQLKFNNIKLHDYGFYQININNNNQSTTVYSFNKKLDEEIKMTSFIHKKCDIFHRHS